MGDEIDRAEFSLTDFEWFQEALLRETNELKAWFRDHRFDNAPPAVGYELEAWLIDDELQPAPINEEFLTRLDNPMVVPELARFNVELNAPWEFVQDDFLERLRSFLEDTWAHCTRVAAEMDASMVAIGILPTVVPQHLAMQNMSGLQRYRALNEQILRLRHGAPMQLELDGSERIRISQDNVMLEAAATSFQLHLQVPELDAARVFNAAQIASGPMVAATSNSPFLFGKELWSETRIPLFEQAVNVRDDTFQRYRIPPRVSFGDGYVKTSLLELFLDNLEQHPVLLPSRLSGDLEQLAHLRLHNGTIWRWNRPLIGFNEADRPHLRIEHRVVPAGPSLVDLVANLALFVGVARGLATSEIDFESKLPFVKARENFYQAARRGLSAEISWFDGVQIAADVLILKHFIPLAEHQLSLLGADRDQVRYYLDVIKRRVGARRTGSDWQRAFVADHGPDMAALLAQYCENQQSGLPVCDWETRC